MKKFLIMVAFFCFASYQVSATEIDAQKLKLTAEQNQKLTELKANLKAEVEPIWEEIQSSRQRITEIEKKYFEEFWNSLNDEQKAALSQILNQ